MLDDTAAMVQAVALRTLTIVLSYIDEITAADTQMFTEYIFPSLTKFTQIEIEEIARLVYSKCILSLAQTACNFLNMSQQLNLKVTRNNPNLTNIVLPYQGNYDVDLEILKDYILKIIIEMLQSYAGSKVKRSLLYDITDLCIFLGRSRVNNDILPHLITVLNDSNWQLRAAFFDNIVGVSIFIGQNACQNFILPCLIQTLFDAELLVIQKSLLVLRNLIEIKLFQSDIILNDIVQHILPLLCHPSIWLRNQAIDLIINISKVLGVVASYTFLYPLLLPMLTIDKDHSIIINTFEHLSYYLKPSLTMKQFNNLIKQANPEKSPVTTTTTAVNLKEEELENTYNLEHDVELLKIMTIYCNKVAASIKIQKKYPKTYRSRSSIAQHIEQKK